MGTTPDPRQKPAGVLRRTALTFLLGPLVAVVIMKHISRITLFQKMLFLDHLRIMVKGGLSLVEALNVLSRETSNKRFKEVISAIQHDVEQGEQLSEALGKHPKIFGSMYVKMIEAGETAGQLEGALDQAVIQMKKTYELSSSIRGAMVYPAVILVAMTGIGFMVITVVLPQLTAIFSEFNSELPLATRILIAMGNTFSHPLRLILVLVITLGLIIGFILLLRRVPPFRAAVHALNLKLPIAGGIIRQINLARFSLTLSSLLKSTIPVVDAITITADTCGNVQFQNALHNAAEAVKRGTPISEALQSRADLFPPMVTEMVMVGEQSGDVDTLLTELAEFYNSEVAKTMKNFTTIIEPVIIILIGIAVGGLAVAVIMPMYSLVQNF
jgi:type II secretory pathway component PulF